MGVLVFLLSFFLFTHFVNYDVGGDAVSMFYPAKQLLASHNLNAWNKLNDRYGTYYFMFPFTDYSIYRWGLLFPTQTPGAILISAVAIALFNTSGFLMVAPFFGATCVTFTYWLTKILLADSLTPILAALAATTMPLVLLWSSITQNISVASAFLIISVFFAVKYLKTDNRAMLAISGLFLAASFWVRIPHLLILPAYSFFLINRKQTIRDNLINVIVFGLPIAVTSALFLFFNYHFFGNPLFIGYLRSGYHPYPPGYQSTTAQVANQYLLSDFHWQTVINSFRMFYFGSTRIYFLLLPLTLVGLFVRTNSHSTRYKGFILVSALILIIYYGNLEPSLWKDNRPEFSWSLSLAFFRYLMPLLLLSTILVALLFKKLIEQMHRVILLLALTLVIVVCILDVNFAYQYNGGSSLAYFDEITTQTQEYSSQLNNKLTKGAVILYDDRKPFSDTFPHTLSYQWFYYDGIPPDVRQQHTKDVTNKLLADGFTVYFVHYDAPYDTLSRIVEPYLRQCFIFTEVPGSEFPRMKTTFYQLSKI